MNNIVEIYKMIKKELNEAPSEEEIPKEINDVYAEMQNLKESIEEILSSEIKNEENKNKEKNINTLIMNSSRPILFKGIALEIVYQIRQQNEDENIEENIKLSDVEHITSEVLNDDYMWEILNSSINNSIKDRPYLINEKNAESEEEL